MPETPRYNPVPAADDGSGGIISTDSNKQRGIKGSSRRSSSSFGVWCGYGFLIISVAFTVLAALAPISDSIVVNPSSSSAQTWFSFDAYRSHFYSYLFPSNSTTTPSEVSQITAFPPLKAAAAVNNTGSLSTTEITLAPAAAPRNGADYTQTSVSSRNGEGSTGTNSTSGSDNSTMATSPSPWMMNGSGEGEQRKMNKTESEPAGESKKRPNQPWWWVDGVESLRNCNLYEGEWVRDESYPLYPPKSCWLVDHQFQCFRNGRPDRDFLKYKWKPTGCDLPRLNATHMLEMLNGKRVVFVGDSLNRNMWESLVCILRNSVNESRNVFEGRARATVGGQLRTIVFKDYELSVEFLVAPFLVRQWVGKDENGKKRETLRIDQMVGSADRFKDADILIFNTGHWWVHEKTSQGKGYYQEGDHVYNQMNATEAFKRSITTWGKWVDANVNASRTQVFFRGYSNAHFSGGQWNSGGRCDNETRPMTSKDHNVTYPWHRNLLPPLLGAMKTQVTYLDITMLTDYRKDGHPSMYRSTGKNKAFNHQDCSHWCLPGVPDLWNQLLYAEMLINLYKQSPHLA